MIHHLFKSFNVIAVCCCGLSFFLLGSMNTVPSDIEPHIQDYDKVMNSINPPLGKTGAPSENDCTSCHSGTPLSPAGVVEFDLNELSDGYKLDSVYDLTLEVSSGPKNGFELTILDVYGNKAGDLTAGTNSNVQMLTGREYISHTSSFGETSFPFQWQAPATDMGDLFVYYAFNKSNNSGDTSGDDVYVGQELLQKYEVAGIEEVENEESLTALYISDKVLFAELNLPERSNIELSAYHLDGRLFFQENLGFLDSGNHSINYSIESENKHEIVLLKLQTENELITKKVVFN